MLSPSTSPTLIWGDPEISELELVHAAGEGGICFRGPRSEAPEVVTESELTMHTTRALRKNKADGGRPNQNQNQNQQSTMR